MRKLKFRAWIAETKEIVNDFENDYGISELNNDFFIVDQLTGLQDKNGIEIYEGDIVEIIIYSNNKIISKSQDVVVFQDSCFGFIFGNRREFQVFTNFHNTTFEVIGNIYQNPELCK